MIYAFELKLLHEVGLQPKWEQTDLAAGTKKIAAALMKIDWPACPRLKPTATQILELRRFLHGFLIFHLGHPPKGRAMALAGERKQDEAL